MKSHGKNINQKPIQRVTLLKPTGVWTFPEGLCIQPLDCIPGLFSPCRTASDWSDCYHSGVSSATRAAMHFLQHILQLFTVDRNLNWGMTCLIITSQLEPCQLERLGNLAKKKKNAWLYFNTIVGYKLNVSRGEVHSVVSRSRGTATCSLDFGTGHKWVVTFTHRKEPLVLKE
jgi:hypothetical protein